MSSEPTKNASAQKNKAAAAGLITVALLAASGGGLLIDHADGNDDFLQRIGIEEPRGVENMHTPAPNEAGKDTKDTKVTPAPTPSAIPANEEGLPADGSKVNLDGISPGGGLAPDNHDWATMAPMELSSPEINLVMPIIESGVTEQKDGSATMNLPVSYQAGWLNTSAPLNAQKGTTSIGGHVNWVGGNLAPMSNIKLAKPGTVIRTSDADGHIQKWKVKTAGDVVKWADLSHKFHIEDKNGPRKLILFTCDQSTPGGPYDSNWVLTAEPLNG